MNKVYVNIPANAIAGGVESLYQLVDAINNCGGNAIAIWDINYDQPIPEKYNHYNIKHSLPIDDSHNNWIIYPEVWTQKLDTYKNMKKGIWWLSVDNNHSNFQDFNNSKITHFYQSFYALDYVQKNGCEKYLALFDYLPSIYTESNYDYNEKKNIVCYNPIKGAEITNKIKELNPDIEFIPIQGMNEEQIIGLLKISKVYIDFGHHPGRDRIPREAAILGNCVITNTKGSAKFYNDIPIDNKYKPSNLNEIGQIIKTCFDDYENIINDFSLYRSLIINQKEQLYNLVKQYFI
jgi:hypothetical protein